MKVKIIINRRQNSNKNKLELIWNTYRNHQQSDMGDRVSKLIIISAQCATLQHCHKVGTLSLTFRT